MDAAGRAHFRSAGWIGLALVLLSAVWLPVPVAAQAHTAAVVGTVVDEQNQPIPGAKVEVRNTFTGYTNQVESDATGNFRLDGLAPDMYQIAAEAPGFSPKEQPLEISGPTPVSIQIDLGIAPVSISVEVTAQAPLLDTTPADHVDVEGSLLSKLPMFEPGTGLSNAIVNSTGGVAADANGFFHPMGDHAQVSFVIDGQAITDQQNKSFSTQMLPTNAIQQMQLVTGAPGAQFGDKSSLVVNATTKSGLNQRPNGDVQLVGGSFGTWAENATLGAGNNKFGNFLTANTMRTGRFLDTPQFRPYHAIGNNITLFDHADYQRSDVDSFHLNLGMARNWMQVPNSLDQLAQDQKQRVLSFNVAPSYQHVTGAATLINVNSWGRRDQVNYYPSQNVFNDTPVSTTQLRFLTNYGAKVDVSTAHRFHTVRYGVQIQRTDLAENFTVGVTNPGFNPVCLGTDGTPVTGSAVTTPTDCSSANPSYTPNPNFQPGLLPYDLTRGGTPFRFRGANGINQYSFYVSDSIIWKNWTIDAGLRDDQYNGLVDQNGLQPRVGASYLVSKTGTVLRAAYSRTFETPFNENLLLSSSTGSGGLRLFGDSKVVPIKPGHRNQYNLGFQQNIAQKVVIDAEYFWKYTTNAYDFDVVFNSPIAFPISWRQSKLDGFTGRVSTVNLHGFLAYYTFGHTRARYFPPEDGGLLLRTTSSVNTVFRIDHDQAFQHTFNLRYQRGTDGPWITWIWRFDSGLVTTGVPDTGAALGLTAAQQVTIGLSCDGTPATFSTPIRDCSGKVNSVLLNLPTPQTENADHNVARVRPRNLFDVAFGTDNLFGNEVHKINLKVTITNLTNKVAVYNFLSTFSGTHFVSPRAVQVAMGYNF